jgi:predicted alpha/beta-hydrolase family hydrolase
VKSFTLEVEGRRFTALYDRPEDARACLVLAHGAGAGMRHPFMDAISRGLVRAGVATFRYQFPYMEKETSFRPDPPQILEATVRAAFAAASAIAKDLPMFAGGKSMGGRMTSQCASKDQLQGARGLVFYGFPLHKSKVPSTSRAVHLGFVTAPMLFLQGTRDSLANLERMREVVAGLGARTTLHVVEGADHGFEVLVRSGRTHEEVLEELASTTATWMRRIARVRAAAAERS